jgi:molybdopterin molybdotransferase
MRLLDAYIAVDWSARSKPGRRKPARDSLWVGELVAVRSGQRSEQDETYCRTRRSCLDHVRERLREHVSLDRRVFLGFDFAYGYPEGFASTIGLAGHKPAWLQIWHELSRLIEDRPDNSNIRFEVASELNS